MPEELFENIVLSKEAKELLLKNWPLDNRYPAREPEGLTELLELDMVTEEYDDVYNCTCELTELGKDYKTWLLAANSEEDTTK